MRLRRPRALRPWLDRLDDRRLLSGLTPGLVTQAYGLSGIAFGTAGGAVPANGSSQTIAVVVAYHDPYLASDLATFDATYGLATPSLTQVNLAGARSNDGWAGEETLDVEWAHAIAPGATIDVVEAASDSFGDMMNAVNTARNVPGVSVVSMSWGMGEFPSESAYDAYFTTPAGHTGVTFIAASGDSGPAAGAEWPAASPNVVGVGGSTLYLNATGTYTTETAWAGSGGEISAFETEPGYQSGVQLTGRKTVPDVAFDANPASGVSVFTTVPSSGRGGWLTVGGTSLGAPAWAGIIAIVDQGRALQGSASLDGGSQTLPAIYHLPATDFHAAGNLTAVGLGTPNGASLVKDLAFGVASTATTTTTGTTTSGSTSTATTTTGTTTTTSPPTTGGQHTGQGRRPYGRGSRWWSRFNVGRPALVASPATSRPNSINLDRHDSALHALVS